MSGARRAGVLGHPIGHSLSPVLHRAAYAELGLDWSYGAHDVEESGLAEFIASLDETWAGLSLTMPLKIAAVPLMDFVEPMAKLIGGVNTVLVQHVGSTRQLVGASTDVYGVVAALREAGLEGVESGVILGGGATATAAMAALGQLGCTSPAIAVRNRARAGGLMRAATKMGVTPRFLGLDGDPAGDLAASLSHADAVVSTIPPDAAASLLTAVTSSRGKLLDVVYEPLVSPFARAWADAGGTAVNGTRMLLHQAGEQVRMMTGREAPLTAMDTALTHALAR